MIDLLIAFLMGALEGVIGFLPISSSGHMVVLEKIIGLTWPSLLIHACEQLGLAFAVASALKRDVIHLLLELGHMLKDGGSGIVRRMKGEENLYGDAYHKVMRTTYRRLVCFILITTIPTLLMGILLEGVAESMSGSVLYTGIGMMLTGIVLLVTDMVTPSSVSPGDIPYWKAVLTGCAQGISVLPGISRSGITISAGIFAGMSKKTSVRVSWLLFILPSVGAAVHEIVRASREGLLTSHVLVLCVLSFAGAALSGVFMIRRMLRLVMRVRLKGFAYYCMIIGCAALVISFL